MYTGKDGLKNAIIKLKESKSNYKRTPKKLDIDMGE
jgi:hypothetical protein